MQRGPARRLDDKLAALSSSARHAGECEKAARAKQRKRVISYRVNKGGEEKKKTQREVGYNLHTHTSISVWPRGFVAFEENWSFLRGETSNDGSLEDLQDEERAWIS